MAAIYNSTNTGIKSFDTTGQWCFVVESCVMSYTYDGSGNILTETAQDPVANLSFMKTYAYTAGKLTSITGWVKQ